MNKFFSIRAEGDYSETQKITAEVGHSGLVRKAFAECVQKHGVKDCRPFFAALKGLLTELSKAGFTQQPNGWHVTGGKFVTFDKMTHHQLFATWASVQQTIAKWVHATLPSNTEIWLEILENDLVFKANDIQAVMELLFEFLQMGKGYFAVDTEQGMEYLEGRLVKCLNR